MRVLSCLTAVLAVTASTFGQGPAGGTLPPDLAAVPPDAFFVVHVRIAEMWKSDAMADIRMIVNKAGIKEIDDFERRFTPSLATIDRVTGYVDTPDFDGPPQFDPVVVVSVTRPFDQKKFVAQALSSAKLKDLRGVSYYTEGDHGMAVRFISDRVFAVGTDRGISLMTLKRDGGAASPLARGLAVAAESKNLVTMCLHTGALPDEAIREMKRKFPPPLHGLLMPRSIVLGIDFEKDGNLYLSAEYPNRDSADAAAKSLAAGTEMLKGAIDDARKELKDMIRKDRRDPKLEDLPIHAAAILGLGALQHGEDLLAKEPIKRNGNEFAGTLALPPQFKQAFASAAFAGALAAPGIVKIRDASAAAQTANNLKQIVLSFHNYESAMGTLPPAAIVDKKGKPLLSWRVLILPYVEQESLYRQFKLDEPWDSEANLKAAKFLPKVYQLPAMRNMQPAKEGHTHFRAFVGNGAAFDYVQARKFADFTDGTSNTWMVAVAGESVFWTKPDELEFDPKKDLPKLADFIRGGFYVGYADGSVRFFQKVPPWAKAAITHGGGEVIPND